MAVDVTWAPAKVRRMCVCARAHVQATISLRYWTAVCLERSMDWLAQYAVGASVSCILLSVQDDTYISREVLLKDYSNLKPIAQI